MNPQELENAALVRRLIEAVDRGETGLVDRYYADDYLDHHPSPARSLGEGRDGIRKAFEVFRSAFPDVRHTIHHLFASADRVVLHVTGEGTHQGELMGVPATGRSVRLEAIAIYRIAAGRIAERWCFQGKGVLEQLREGTVNPGTGSD